MKNNFEKQKKKTSEAAAEERIDDKEDSEWVVKFKNGEFNTPTYIYYAERCLDGTYGVENMTTTEKWWLKKIVEEFIPRYREERKLEKEGKVPSYSIPPWPQQEIARQWLHEVYGIAFGDIFSASFIVDETDPEKPEKIYFPRIAGEHRKPYNEQLWFKKSEELKAKGRKVYTPLINWEISPEFKEHLKILREKAEIPEPKE